MKYYKSAVLDYNVKCGEGFVCLKLSELSELVWFNLQKHCYTFQALPQSLFLYTYSIFNGLF